MTVIEECLVGGGAWIVVLLAGELIGACDRLEVERRRIYRVDDCGSWRHGAVKSR